MVDLSIMDNTFFRLTLALFLAAFYSTFTSASAVIQMPSVPTVISPLSSAVDISINPTLAIDILQLADESGSMIRPGTIKEAQWLLSKENQVVLVGGNTLANSQRELVAGRSFDISGLGLTLGGQNATSIYVDSKRLEVTSAGTLLGFIELPAFMFQADNKDEFQAARVRFYQDSVVVQWHYGDSLAAQPWELYIEASFSNNQLTIKSDEAGLDSDFINTYGNEEIRFSDESTWFGHKISSIFNVGNLAYCSLADSVSTCSNVSLSSGPLTPMGFMNEQNHKTSSSQFSIIQPLEAQTEYFLRVRQAIDDGTGATLYGNWSLFSSFTTEATVQAPVIQMPAIPSVSSPIDTSVDVDLTPTLEISQLQLIDETGSVLETGVLKESQWLLSKENQIALVGGNTLDNNQRELVAGTSFDISGLELTLGGQNATSIYVDSKRLEVKAAGSLLGFIELPAFMYQADNKDEFQAARVRFYQDGVVVQWHYGDAASAHPWDLKIQATINNNELNIRFDDVGFNQDFITAFGDEEVKFSNSTTWNGHALSEIAISGNKAACRLVDLASSCFTTYLDSGVTLNSMEIMVDLNTTSESSQLAVLSALEAGTQYYWRTRQAIDDGMGGNLYGNWSDFSGFSTVAGEQPPSIADIQVGIGHAGDYWGQKASSSFIVSNINGEALANITLKIEKPQNRKIISFPEQCTESEMLIECVISSERSSEQLSIGYEFTEKYSEKSYSYQVCIESVCSDLKNEFFGTVSDLNEMTSYSAELASTIELSTLTEPQIVPFTTTITNTSNVDGRETHFVIKTYTSHSVSVDTAGCSVESEFGEGNLILCINSLAAGETMLVQFSFHPEAEHFNVGYAIMVNKPCEFGACDSNDVIEETMVYIPAKESSSGGALLFLPVLIAFLRRRQYKA